jgi:hypothetical protein
MYATCSSAAASSEPYSVGLGSGTVVVGSDVGGSDVGGLDVGGSDVGGSLDGTIVGSAVVGFGAAVEGSVVCTGTCVWVAPVVWLAVAVALCVPDVVAVAVGAAELDAVSEADGIWEVVVGVDAEGVTLEDAERDAPVTCADMEVAGPPGTLAQFEPLGRGTSALLAAATTPMNPKAARLPNRPIRSDLGSAANQSRSLSAFAFRKRRGPPVGTLGALHGAC